MDDVVEHGAVPHPDGAPIANPLPKGTARTIGTQTHGKVTEAELAYADHLLDEGILVGQVGRFVRPFSRQLKQEIRRLFPADRETFDYADEASRIVEIQYLTMRAVTLLLLVVFLGVTYGLAFACVYPGSLARLPVHVPWLTTTPAGLRLGVVSAVCVTVGGTLYLLRIAVRTLVFSVLIDPRMHRFTHQFSSTYQGALVAAMARAQESEDRSNSAWAENAYRATRAALYHGKRAEYLDRYGTTTLWNIHEFFRRFEVISWFAKGLVGVSLTYGLLALGAPASGERWLGIPIAYLCEVVLWIEAVTIGIFGWGISRRESDALTGIFETGFSALRDTWQVSEREMSYMTLLPELVRNLVSNVLSYARSTNKG